MHIRKTTPSDLDDLVRIYDIARKFMIDNGNPTQWGTDWPNMDKLLEYTKSNGYVVVDVSDKVVASFGLFKNADELSYKTIDGAWLNNSPYGVVHTLASDGSIKGVTKLVLDFALKECGNIKVDTHASNTKMLHILNKDNWHYCGKINIAEKGYNGDTERLAFQKIKS